MLPAVVRASCARSVGETPTRQPPGRRRYNLLLLAHYYLTQRNAAVIGRNPLVRINLEATGLKGSGRALRQITVLKNSTAEHDLFRPSLSGDFQNPVDQCIVEPRGD